MIHEHTNTNVNDIDIGDLIDLINRTATERGTNETGTTTPFTDTEGGVSGGGSTGTTTPTERTTTETTETTETTTTTSSDETTTEQIPTETTTTAETTTVEETTPRTTETTPATTKKTTTKTTTSTRTTETPTPTTTEKTATKTPTPTTTEKTTTKTPIPTTTEKTETTTPATTETTTETTETTQTTTETTETTQTTTETTTPETTTEAVDLELNKIVSNRTPAGVCKPNTGFETDAQGNPLEAGQIIDDEFAVDGITVYTKNAGGRPVMVFNSSDPTDGDLDLGSPNEDFGGPGIGAGGEQGQPGANDNSLENVFIISSDNNSDIPNDYAGGGTIVFEFDQPTRVDQLEFLDIDDGDSATITAYDGDGNQIKSVESPELGDNSYNVAQLDAENVHRLEVTFPGSGSVSGITFCKQIQKGDTVTFNVTATNNGTADATGVTVEDALPEGLDYDSSTASQGSYDPESGIWTVGALASSESATLQLTAEVTTTTKVTNVAQVNSTDQQDTPKKDLDSIPRNGDSSEDDQDAATVKPDNGNASATAPSGGPASEAMTSEVLGGSTEISVGLAGVLLVAGFAVLSIIRNTRT